MTSIMVATPNMGKICVELAYNWIQWFMAHQYDIELFTPSFQKPVESARNEVVDKFLNGKREYLFFIDSDQCAPNDVLDLAKLDMDIVSAVCFMNKEGKMIPSALKKEAEGYKVLGDLTRNKIYEVDATGTGCLMIKRRVLETMPPPWFQTKYDDKGILSLGNDFVFCRKAKAYGFQIFVHTGYITKHYQDTDLTAIALANTTRQKSPPIKSLNGTLIRNTG